MINIEIENGEGIYLLSLLHELANKCDPHKSEEILKLRKKLNKFIVPTRERKDDVN